MNGGLNVGESRIMDLHDAGERVDTIAARTGYGRNYVEQVIGRYAVSERSLSTFDRMSAAGTASLLRAMHMFHPETQRGVHP